MINIYMWFMTIFFHSACVCTHILSFGLKFSICTVPQSRTGDTVWLCKSATILLFEDEVWPYCNIIGFFLKMYPLISSRASVAFSIPAMENMYKIHAAWTRMLILGRPAQPTEVLCAIHLVYKYSATTMFIMH